MRYKRADGNNKPRFDFRGYPKGLTERLLLFGRILTPLDRTDWIYAIGSDQYLTEHERLLGIQISNHLNLERQECHPQQEMLGARLGITTRAVRRRLKMLRSSGWLAVKTIRGKRREAGRPANEYVGTIPVALLNLIRAELPDAWASYSVQDVKAPNNRTPRRPPFREGIGNKKERGFGDEVREARKESTVEDTPKPEGRVFVEYESPEWDAWCRATDKFPRHQQIRIDGRLKWGRFFPTAWPTSEFKPKLNGGSAPISEIG